MQHSTLLFNVVAVVTGLVLIGMLLRPFRQPQLVAYILAGVLMGPAALGWVEDTHQLEQLGELGVTLLLFFIGLEVSPRELARGWRIAVIGTGLQIALSVGAVWLVGWFLDWPLPRILLLGFVISLSSTAVVIKLLQDSNELHSPVGKNTLLILLAQDIAVVPMMILLASLGSQTGAETVNPWIQLGGGAVLVALTGWLLSRESISLPFLGWVRDNHEMQVFVALLLCFGCALITSLIGLSAPLGAFIGGMIIGRTQEIRWVHDALEPLHIIFVALFFVSVGMLIDPAFLLDNLATILLLVVLVLVTNTFINALILKVMGEDWKDALLTGAMLSQIGEFSFVLASVGLASGIVGKPAYQLTVAVIAFSLLASPLWIKVVSKEVRRRIPGP